VARSSANVQVSQLDKGSGKIEARRAELIEFLAMGGYAAYVWPAFAIALVLMVGLWLQSRRAARRSEALLEELRAKARPMRPRAARPMRPRREVDQPAEPRLDEGG
jgi:heme exporter protein D